MWRRIAIVALALLFQGCPLIVENLYVVSDPADIELLMNAWVSAVTED